jgi:hypothetical protein
MIRLSLVLSFIGIAMIGPGNAGPIDYVRGKYEDWRSEKVLAEATVRLYESKMVKYTLDSIRIAGICAREGQNSADRMDTDRGLNQRAIDVYGCCATFTVTSYSRVVSPLVRSKAFRAPRTTVPDEYKQLVGYAEKVARDIVKKTRPETPKAVMEQAEHAWSNSFGACAAVLR